MLNNRLDKIYSEIQDCYNQFQATGKEFNVTLIKSKVQRKWPFSNLVSIIRQQLMNYINIDSFLEDPEGSWRAIVKENEMKYQNSIFPEWNGAYF